MLRPGTPRLLLLLPTATYRTAAFVEAARRVGVDLTVASERPSTFQDANPGGLVTLDLSDPDRAAGEALAFERVKRILEDAGYGIRDARCVGADASRIPDLASRSLLVEDFIPGREYALEGLLVAGELHTLALFDKPDPLDGPYFEETIYVTPSRLPADGRRAVAVCAARAAAALGLREGPVHAELRVNASGPWLIELAARPIGGRCSAALRFRTGA